MSSGEAAEAVPPAGAFPRRDRVRKLESEIQAQWEEHRIFEADVNPEKKKYLVSFPYPYCNARAHIGHAFTLCKVDFAAGYKTTQGYNVVWPFGLHVTGSPIQSAAFKLKAEMEKYGVPVVVPDEEESAAAAAEADAEAAPADVSKFKGKKSKLTAKTGGKSKTQWDILVMSGVPEEEIPKFADPLYWLDYFPRLYEQDLKLLGTRVDWRRSFITTSLNPFYDAFIRWQFVRLKEAGKIDFGRRPTVFSPLDKQACADHDRSKGENVGPQEYMLVKLQLLEAPESVTSRIPELSESIAKGHVFMVAATLRPETMYGQTNCYVLPSGEYGVYEFDVQHTPKSAERTRQVLICAARAARNMSYQDAFVEPGSQGQLKQLGTVSGKELVGVPVKAPKAKYERVYALPLLSISMTKGTGIVTSVPSDSADDYAALRDWKTDEKLRAKHGVTEEMVAPFELVPVINIPGLGDRAAETMVLKLKIKSQHDEKKLKEAKAETYKRGFYEGIMIAGKEDGVEGMKVSEAKDVVKAKMCEDGEAIVYFEPESEVVSRSGDECVVAHLDQWFLKYGEEEWREKVKDYVRDPKNFETFTDSTRKAFMDTLDWLEEWACSRSFGLGTLVPWDEQFVIESLSDSTIYMAYYTICHLLQGRKDADDYTGDRGNGSPLGIKPDQLTPAVFDYIFLGNPYPEDCGIEEHKLKVLRESFEYWYPLDLRVSGRDLIRNHLTMSLYTHAAIWPDREDLWPQAFSCNGFVQVENEKMSKSKGNFFTIQESVAGHRSFEQNGKKIVVGWTADATRLALAAAGDSLDDANFSCEVADKSILRLTTELDWAEEVLAEKAQAEMRDVSAEEYNFFERAFNAQMNLAVEECQVAYEAMRYRDVVKTGFYEFLGFRDAYRDACARQNQPLHRGLVRKFLETLAVIMAPVCPHFCEKIWRDYLGKSSFVVKELWPTVEKPDVGFVRSVEYMGSTIRNVRVKAEKEVKQRKKKNAANANEPIRKVQIVVNDKYPAYQEAVFKFLASKYDAETRSFPDDIMKQLKDACKTDDLLKKNMKDVMKTAAQTMMSAQELGPQALELSVPYDQRAVLEENREYVTSAMDMDEFEVVAAEENDAACSPGNPRFVFP
ncbi:Leucine--tRNA ligase, cytoplasmic [Hondaea fermentalgiana]|uniref:leucine--tRNA ligase n=1 Tax=Hondaea fermentalgiana TaxID=2315210 RepID=A0A2R5GAC1_9STRA|nr:Leucine--tRNA ligase, cytoplasmic [Hondaea fermentalgiana]|eukprot:GBG27535.1 Leucine--tRNA ligase, cytoplasmic [Hondaea fermentalgiana]